MTCIAEIQAFVQEYAATIAEVLELDVTIVDEDCVRIGGTGPYFHSLGQAVPSGSFFRKILQTGQPGIIDSAQRGEACHGCSVHKCEELATMGIPIFMRGKPVGVIGIMAFTAEQQRKIADTSSKLWGFLNHMSSLLESKLLLIEANQRLEQQVRETMEVMNKNCCFGTMIGRSHAFTRLVQEAKQIAPGHSTVLIRGESGTGKELLAKAIHSESKRSRRPFIVVNCPSIPDNLLETELFGYEGGAFTGAKSKGKPGKFELADQGTIFLDEIGDLPLSLQPKLLRVLQEKTIERIGGRHPIPVDVRVIAATNRGLEDMVRQGTFREDLYYRLNVIPLFIPPLRQRKEDTELYLEHFVTKYAHPLDKPDLKIEPQLKQWFKDYQWPGNIRQLENVVEYMVNMVKGQVISFQALPYYLAQEDRGMRTVSGLGLEQQLAQFEQKLLTSCLPRGASLEDKKRAAKELGISLATLYRKLEKYQLH